MNLARLLVGIFISICVKSPGQLLPSRVQRDLTPNKQIEVITFGTIKGSGFTTRTSTRVWGTLKSRWSGEVEISAMDKSYKSSTGFAPRTQHYYTLISVGRKIPISTSGAIEHVSVAAGRLTVRDLRTNVRNAREWNASISARLKNGADLSLNHLRRNDSLAEPFVLREVTYGRDAYTMSGWTVNISLPSGPLLSHRGTVYHGTYYGSIIQSVRYAINARCHHKLSALAEVEYAQLKGEFPCSGFLVRSSVSHSPYRFFRTEIGLLKNTFCGFTAIVASATFTRHNHAVKGSFRKLLDRSMQSITTDNIHFASNFLVQYAYRLSFKES